MGLQHIGTIKIQKNRQKNSLKAGWVLCLIFIVFSIVFRSILAGEGDMKFPVMVAAIGTILNVILDPIFIFDLEKYGGFGFFLDYVGILLDHLGITF